MNVYYIGITEDNEVVSLKKAFIVHSSDNIGKVRVMKEMGKAAWEIAYEFCGNCGEHVPEVFTECSCGNLQRQ